MTLYVTGRRSQIIRELERLLPSTEVLLPSIYSRHFDLSIPRCSFENVIVADRYVYAAGVINSLPIQQQPAEMQARTMAVNCLNAIHFCETMLARQAQARICVIGSESAWLGSHDQVYAASKAALHAYVLSKHLNSNQQLICIAPPLISDAGMTKNRHDYPAVLKQRRTVTSNDVARRILDLLYTRPIDGNTGKLCTMPGVDLPRFLQTSADRKGTDR